MRQFSIFAMPVYTDEQKNFSAFYHDLIARQKIRPIWGEFYFWGDSGSRITS